MAEMKEDQNNLNDKQENERSETSFDDLPDDVHIHIMEKLDLASCLKLRVNRRLDRIQHSVKKELNGIYINALATGYQIKVHNSNIWHRSDFESLEKGLHRLVLSTISVDDISMRMYVMPNEEHGRIMNALAKFVARSCWFSGRADGRADLWNLPQVNLPFVLTSAQNIAEFTCDSLINSLTAQDLCIIRKTILEGRCRLKKCVVLLEEGMEKSFLEACFGVTVEDFLGPLRGRMYRATYDSVELYSSSPLLNEQFDSLSHFQGDFETAIALIDGPKYHIFIQNLEEGDGNQMIHGMDKIRMNHFYIMN